MQTKSGLRPRRAGWYAGALLLVLALLGLVLYGTGVIGSGGDDDSVDRACGGTLAQGGLSAALHSSRLSAEDLDDGDYLAACRVRTEGSGAKRGSLEVKLRWSTSKAPDSTLVWYNANYNGVRDQAAPLGHGWSGVVRRESGTYQVMVALDCVNQRNKALVAYGDLLGAANSTTLTGLGRVTTETAREAAEKHGCQVEPGRRVTGLSPDTIGRPDAAGPLRQADGSCAALRDTEAERNGTPDVLEYPADTDTPQVNCYLVTKTGKPGYGLYAYYGASAKDFLASEEAALKAAAGPYGERDYAWATATCPRSAQPAVFALYHLYDEDTEGYPVPHYSASFARSALTAFAAHEAKQRGCGSVRMVTQP
ncbi:MULTISPECIES: hypothetical protein [Streptomyces]|uniref:hypothetical protein n=1 Tax=Streptomyces TaxID=1883 RepID=UPI00167BB7D2|nr:MULTISPECIES: hypothetical protein [Streptomyces]MBK3523237.1 hypothetical protein [Streptomyces sp. MBT70]GGR52955.1 hypothetical protein GCM10010236_00690 [Streptomyces eurythermus]